MCKGIYHGWRRIYKHVKGNHGGTYTGNKFLTSEKAYGEGSCI